MSNAINNLYEFGGFQLNAEKGSLWREDKLIPLSPKAFELLKLLVEKEGEVVSKQEIFERVWADTFVEDGVLTQNIYTLRQALGNNEEGKPLIENLARRGYRLSVPIRKTAGQPSAQHFQGEEAAAQSGFERGAGKRFGLGILMGCGAILIAGLIAFFGYQAYISQKADSGAGIPPSMKFHRLTDTGDASYLTISPDGNLAAYTKGFELFIKDLRNESEVKLNIEGGLKPACLQFSPDGFHLYFGTIRAKEQQGAIYRVSRSGGKAETIAERIWSGFSISPDGKEAAFVRRSSDQGRESLFILDLASAAEQEIKSISAPESFYWNNYPAWSADGKRIAMVVVSAKEHFLRLLLIGRSGEEEKELKPDGLRNIEQVAWNSRGDELIASANDGNTFQLWKVSLADGSKKRITNDLNSYLGIAVSADRKKLISRQRIYFSNIWVGLKENPASFKQLTTGNSRNDGLQGLCWIDEERLVYSTNDEKLRDWNLWVLNTTDSTKQKITSDTEKQNDNPAISPDRKSIYFTSDRNQESRVWRIDLDGSNPEQVTFGENEVHSYPQVSPDGEWLYFIIRGTKTSTIGRKSLRGDLIQELSGEVKYVPGNFLSISPDGSYLAFEKIDEEGHASLAKGSMAVGIISTKNPDDVSFIQIPAWMPKAEWGRDGKSLDFISGNVRSNGLRRIPREKGGEATLLLGEGEGNIFNFAWSPSGEKIALAKGQLLRDVVLISNAD